MSSIPVVEGQPDTISIEEHSEVGPVNLTERDHEALETTVNGGEDGPQRLGIRYTRDGSAYLRSGAFVGIVALPDGPTVKIDPKTSVDSLLAVLRYAFGCDPSVIETREELAGGGDFVNAIAAVYLQELEDVIRQGLDKEYVRTEATERYVRGQIDAHQQLQRAPVAPITFDCRYEELTHGTLLNAVVLRATKLLARLADGSIAADLHGRAQRLEQRVPDRSVTWEDADRIDLHRLNEHYDTLLDIAREVLRHSFVSDVRSGDQTSFSLLVNMNSVFESVVERAADAVADRRNGWRVERQAETDSLLEGTPEVTLYPDVLLRVNGDPYVVADAKWKTSRRNGDLYQLLAYQSAHDAPGILFYPYNGGSVSTEYMVSGGSDLTLVELPTNATPGDGSTFAAKIEKKLAEAFESVNR